MIKNIANRIAALGRHHRHGRPAVIFTLVVLAAVWSSFTVYAFDLWDSLEEEAEQELYSARTVMRAHTDSVYRMANVLLSVTEDWLARNPPGSVSRPLDELQTLLGKLEGEGDHFITIGLINSAEMGFWRLNLGEFYGNEIYLGDRDYIDALRDKKVGERFLGAPVIGRTSGLRVVPVAIRVPPNSLDVKYVSAFVTESIFSDTFNNLTEIAPSIVGIARDDGMILFVWPPDDNTKKSLSPGLSDIALRTEMEMGRTSILPSLDGSGDLLAAYEAVPDHPLHVFVGIKISDLIGLFWRRLTVPISLACLTTIVIALLGVWLKNLMELEADKSTKLSEALLNAEAANESKSLFLANMSHELRTPLNAIIGFSEILSGQLYGPLGKPRYVDYAKDIGDAGRHLLSIISQILDLALSGSDILAVTDTVAELDENILSCIRLLKEKSKDRSVEIVLCPLTGQPPVRMDPVHLRQVMLNLIDNAIKFSREGGTIEIDVNASEKDRLRITVRDHGIGIKPESMRKLFKPFAQVEESLSRTHGGVGLGLTNTRRLVEAYDGQVWLESEFGAGTTAIFTVPIAGRPAASGAPRS